MNRYGWIPDLPDYRDRIYRATVDEEAALPPAVDLRAGCSPVEDQGDLGSCTANAIVGVLEYDEERDGDFVDLSRLFLYYEERKIEHTINYDSGAMIRDGIKVAAKTGVPPETDWPYDISKFTDKPPIIAYRDAALHKITRYSRVLGLNSVKASIANKLPVAFGFTVYESFESDATTKTGIVTMPGPDERVLGGHAICAVGYDDGHQWIIIRNSWGTSWGDAGYGYMPYDYIRNANLSDDFWQVQK